MTTIELQQRKIIIKTNQVHYLNSSDEIMPFIKSNELSKNETILLAIYGLGLLYMENRSDEEITHFVTQINSHNKETTSFYQRIVTKASESNNKIENAIKEITKIALEIQQ